jgi:hypothetical protein
MAQMPNDVIDGIFHDGYMAGYDEGRKAGAWDMFKRITNAYYDKEIYFCRMTARSIRAIPANI